MCGGLAAAGLGIAVLVAPNLAMGLTATDMAIPDQGVAGLGLVAICQGMAPATPSIPYYSMGHATLHPSRLPNPPRLWSLQLLRLLLGSECITALAWDHECTAADAPARQLDEVEHHLTGFLYLEPTVYEAVVITNLHGHVVGVQNI
jgi:hypothetical protein